MENRRNKTVIRISVALIFADEEVTMRRQRTTTATCIRNSNTTNADNVRRFFFLSNLYWIRLLHSLSLHISHHGGKSIFFLRNLINFFCVLLLFRSKNEQLFALQCLLVPLVLFVPIFRIICCY